MKIPRKIAAIGAGIVMVTVISVSTAPVAWADAYGCNLTTPNVHVSTHSNGKRLNFVPILSCASEPKGIGMGIALQRKSGSSWVNVPWETKLLDNKPKYMRISLSIPCTTTTTAYRGAARKKIDGVWSDWKYSNVTTPSCPTAGGGGGGGGGGSWSVPEDLL